MTESKNPLRMRGIEFTEFAEPAIGNMHRVFTGFGFSMTRKLKGKDIVHYRQNGIHFLLNRERRGFSAAFTETHGPAICSMGWRVDDAEFALSEAVRRGATPAAPLDCDLPYPAIYGIGDSLIYFIDRFSDTDNIWQTDFESLEDPVLVRDKGFIAIDHLTNNVYKGTMHKWAEFYKSVFGFEEVRYFDIKGRKTALVSFALRSPDGSFCIPINEGKDDNNNQIDEYLNEYNGPGVQHLAFLTNDLVASCDALDGSGIETLDIHDDYYDQVFKRVPWVREDRDKIRQHQILADSQSEGSYLLQIFTKNLFGPIFIEMIQREDDLGFGEGNFQALFESIERDQERRGVI
ncbi:4-hydroxyphenylpyruvate dioxygenase [Biformimicrobium ophioploci]|uniref:4-hydroxyphenylpyruvate dioxygenase n=1 Tax=Biformimicrobium ophioploci TaxID=3036711 RepID=A0ABQ6LWD1_9GAMM|nr:4-hydroxyphenylpyruvate dioxygenase [Microbulbifer sp. NKW57]GMG86368.1 4-hydroxyphenylpyruvate dioxygenase [Microbulbifer sp. NKW57]